MLIIKMYGKVGSKRLKQSRVTIEVAIKFTKTSPNFCLDLSIFECILVELITCLGSLNNKVAKLHLKKKNCSINLLINNYFHEQFLL